MASLSPRVSGETRETLFTTLTAPSKTARHPRKAFSVSYLFNRVEVAGLRLPPLPHHPACGSAPRRFQ
jgi:hypothetical protein